MNTLILILASGGLVLIPVLTWFRHRLDAEESELVRLRAESNRRALADLVRRLSDDDDGWL